MIILPAKVLTSFVAAGWHQNRCTAVESFVPKDHPAWQVLAQFGGLIVGKCGAGIECATSDVVFRTSQPDDSDDEIAAWQRLLNTTLISIADVHHGHGELFIDPGLFTRLL